MGDIQITFKGKKITSKECAGRFAEFLLIKGVVGPDVDLYSEYLLKFLEREKKI